jgi:CHAD domain-containing protein
MSSRTRLLEEPADIASRRVALSLLTAASKACAKLADSDDQEALHDFRVAVRRLRTWLRAYSPTLGKGGIRKCHKQLGKLTAATNAGRDDQVQVIWLKQQLARKRIGQLEQTGIRMMLEQFEAHRHDVAAGTLEAVTRDFAQIQTNLAARLHPDRSGAPIKDTDHATRFGQVAGQIVHTKITLLATQLGLITKPTDAEQCHDARLACKRLRYLIEPLRHECRATRGLLRQLKQLQDVLGDLHDLQVLERRVAAAIRSAAGYFADHLISTAALATQRSQLGRSNPQLSTCHALAAVAQRIGSRQRALFQSLDKQWLAGNASDFFEQCNRMIDDLQVASKQAGI